MLDKYVLQEPFISSAVMGRIHMMPHLALRPYIAHYTIYFPSSDASEVLHIIPDASGCFVFCFGEKGVESNVCGASTKMVTVKNKNTPPFLFVEFLPAGMRRLLCWPVEELTDKQLNLNELDCTIEKYVLDAVEFSATVAELVHKLDQFFMQKLILMPEEHSMVFALQFLQKTHLYHITVKELSAQFFYSTKQLNRIFKKHLGINAKSYCNILKINCLLQDINTGNPFPIDFREIAFQYGYYDQAHLNHHFKLVCGTSPTEYIKNMSLFYNEPYKF